ncbi:MAG: tyrosine-type recombinase/integrase [Aeromicrobium sp.]|uniref:tyrosine-type recombinase/integrase n=1 Tax=Aeromicrobium sp. TaxID=1871063 RepID=UPI002615971F|nr:tyrosine-type recombinase/integrase [Aeromicrobium sp.]MDF1705077.1 tyrosine-type recombinase/integrase [Aeromicrobium sp.]
MNWTQAIGAYTTYLTAGGAPLTTIATRRQHLRQAAKGLGLDRSPWDVTDLALSAYFGAQRWAVETRRGHRTSLVGFYRWGAKHGATSLDVAEALPRVKPAAPAPRPVSDEAYRHALVRGDVRTRLMVRLAAECGLRRAEVAGLHSDDLVEDMAGWTLRVRGKGGKVRDVPLPDALSRDLRALPRGYVFPGDDHGHLSPRWVGTLVSRALPDAWTMHKLRHRAATRWYAVDRDTFTVQDLLGHASPATTRAYVAIPNDSLRRTVEAAL